MAIIQQAIQRKLSALLGAEVSFDKLNVSLLGGSVEAIGVRVADLLTVARVVAKVAIGRALKGEFVVTSVTIEKPVVTLIRSADGLMNLPKPKSKASAASVAPTPTSASAAKDDEDDSRWTFDVEKVLVIDGEASFAAPTDYRATIHKLLLELKRTGEGYALTMLADSVGRRDVPIELGQLKGTATLGKVRDLTAIASASADAVLELGNDLKLKLRTDEIRSQRFDLTFDGKIDLPRLKALLP